jgi:GH25 family lysozyme M1 (1,4-beta-N-acetylmuramidase)
MDLVAAKAAGISFMTHKIGEGTSYTDAKFATFYKRAKAAGIPLIGAYYVNHNGKQNPQADRFLDLLDAQAPGWRDGPFLLQIDAERWADGTPTATEVEAFAHRLLANVPTHTPFIYGPKWVYGDMLKGAGVPLWASNYGSNPVTTFKGAYPGDDSSRWDAYSGQVPAVLQYGSKTKIAGQSTCDANAFRGSLADLTELAYPKGKTLMAKLDPDDYTAIRDAILNAPITLVDQPDVKYSGPSTLLHSLLASISYYGLQSRNQNALGFQAVKAELDGLNPADAVDLDALAEKVVEKLAEKLAT